MRIGGTGFVFEFGDGVIVAMVFAGDPRRIEGWILRDLEWRILKDSDSDGNVIGTGAAPRSVGAETAEYQYLRSEMLLRSAIQNLTLIISAALLFWTILSLETPSHTWAIPAYFGASFGLAGIWAHNDNLQIRMSAYLVCIEGGIGAGWEEWVKSGRARLSGPVRSGHQLTTRGFFLGSQLLLAGILWMTRVPSRAGVFVCLVAFAATVLVLIPARIRKP